MTSKANIYLLHRLGTLFGAIAALLWFAFFIENLSILDQPIGRASFFWSIGLILVTVPFMLVFSKKDSLGFILFSLSFFGLFGLLAFVLPRGILARTLSILAIGVILVLIVLNRRKLLVFKMRFGITPSMFIESLAILGISWLFTLTIEYFGFASSLFNSVPPELGHFLLWIGLFILFSGIAILARLVAKPPSQIEVNQQELTPSRGD